MHTPDIIDETGDTDNFQIKMFQDETTSTNLTSNDNGKKYKIHLKHSQELRTKKLLPILKLIENQDTLNDDKLRKLKEIID